MKSPESKNDKSSSNASGNQPFGEHGISLVPPDKKFNLRLKENEEEYLDKNIRFSSERLVPFFKPTAILNGQATNRQTLQRIMDPDTGSESNENNLQEMSGEIQVSTIPDLDIGNDELENAPEYNDLPSPSNPDQVYAKRISNVIQRDGPGLGVDVQVSVPWSASVTLVCRDCNLHTFRNLLGPGNDLDLIHEPQIQGTFLPWAQRALQFSLPVLNQHIHLHSGNWFNQLEASLTAQWTFQYGNPSAPGAQVQAQLHLYERSFYQISVVGNITGALSTNPDGSRHVTFGGGGGLQFSVTFR